MRMEGHRMGVLGRAFLGVGAIGLLAGLCACGTVGAATGSGDQAGVKADSASQHVPLCAAPSHLDRVIVIRTVGFGKKPGEGPPLAGVTVTDAPAVRAVAAALCALPAAPHGVVHCPMDTGGGYRFLFSAGKKRYPLVAVEVTGCRTVTGVGTPRTAGSAFFKSLSTILGHVAGHPTLRPA
jgi:hypothetical protein